MFLYIRDGNALYGIPELDLRFLPHTGFHTVNHNGHRLIWTQDMFTECLEGPDRTAIWIRRPRIDRVPVVKLVWKRSSDEVTVDRRWSGEFSAYIGVRPTYVIASHLRLIAWFFKGLPPSIHQLQPGWKIRFVHGALTVKKSEIPSARMKSAFDYEAAVRRIRDLVTDSVRRVPVGSALLLSGGVDSSIIAAVGRQVRRRMKPHVFRLKHLIQAQGDVEDDFVFAKKACAHLSCRLSEMRLNERRLLANAVHAVALGETPRGTIIDDCVALMEVARRLKNKGFSTVVMGEAADDLFGGFKFALRYYKGRELQQYFMHELNVSLPNELCIIQKMFEPWGISVVHPYWTLELKQVAERLPLSIRVDSKRLMKRILREAFDDILPAEVIERPKGVTRDTTQIRLVMEKRFGKSRERYRVIFDQIFRGGLEWPQKRKY